LWCRNSACHITVWKCPACPGIFFLRRSNFAASLTVWLCRIRWKMVSDSGVSAKYDILSSGSAAMTLPGSVKKLPYFKPIFTLVARRQS
jgi:hypothetical protein